MKKKPAAIHPLKMMFESLQESRRFSALVASHLWPDLCESLRVMTTEHDPPSNYTDAERKAGERWPSKLGPHPARLFDWRRLASMLHVHGATHDDFDDDFAEGVANAIRLYLPETQQAKPEKTRITKPKQPTAMPRKHGVRAKHAAMILNGGNKKAASQTVTRWRKRRNPTFPPSIGHPKGNSQIELYELESLVEFIEKQGDPVDDDFRDTLTSHLESAYPQTVRTVRKIKNRKNSETTQTVAFLCCLRFSQRSQNRPRC